jgi:hypothetical protein
MSDINESVVEPKVLSGWVCVAIGAGFLAGLVGLIIAVRVLAG